ncbi:UNVERIFIED_CONTAM: hypothetical protein FKN15_019982 [Acipenser sinensis]
MSDKVSEDDIWEYTSVRKKPNIVEHNTKKLKEMTKLDGNKTTRQSIGKKNRKKNLDNSKASSLEEETTPDVYFLHQHPSTPIKQHGRVQSNGEKQAATNGQTVHEGHCPGCQMPFSVLVVQTPRWHVAECLDTPGSGDGTECPDGLHCSSTIPNHYKRYTHFLLAQSRATGDQDCCSFNSSQETLASASTCHSQNIDPSPTGASPTSQQENTAGSKPNALLLLRSPASAEIKKRSRTTPSPRAATGKISSSPKNLDTRQSLVGSQRNLLSQKGTGFVVDAFQYGAVEGCTAYFLTHFHSDHYGGLKKSFRLPIYCNKITGNLVKSKLGVEEQYVNILPMNTECTVDGVGVTLLDANHCPGSAMLLFHLPNGKTVLHTGDFRADPSMERYPELVGQKVQTLYLDTTYCSPEYTFPSQQEAITFAATTAFETLTSNPRTLVVCGTYSIGKEKVFLAIADVLGCKVCVSRDKYNIMCCLESERIKELITMDWDATQLHVLPMMQVSYKGLQTHLNKFSGKYDQIVAFKPTGWVYSGLSESMANIRPRVRGNITVYDVPYSEHSGYLEMKRFVQWLKPEKIIPTVNVGNPKERRAMESVFWEWKSEMKQKTNEIHVANLTDGGKAARANIVVGDVVLSIDGISTNGMTHLEAQNKIKTCPGSLNLTLQKEKDDDEGIPSESEEDKRVLETKAREMRGSNSFSGKKNVKLYGLQLLEIQITGFGSSETVKSTQVSIFGLVQTVRSTGATKPASVPKDDPQEIFKPVPIASPLPTAPKSTPAPSAAYNKTARPFGATAAPKAASIPSASSAFTPASTPHSFAAPPPPPFATAAFPPPPAVYASTNAKPILDGHMPPPSAAKVTVAPSVNVPPQPSVYNTPINLYSNNNACEVAEGQRRGLNQKDAAQHNG